MILLLPLLFPWFAGMFALVVGELAVGDSLWLLLFAVPAVAVSYGWVFSRA